MDTSTATSTVTPTAVGTVKQELYLPGLPTGVTLLLTQVTFKIPKGDWSPGLMTVKGYISKNTTPDEMKRILPLEISPSTYNGSIGDAILTTTSVTDSGEGPVIYLRFKLKGTTTVNGRPLNLDSVLGDITVSSTNWPVVGRPDFCNLSYLIAGQPPENYANPVPTLIKPDPVHFVIAASPEKGKRVGINASVDKSAINELIGWALKGIFYIHQKAIGWVIGKL